MLGERIKRLRLEKGITQEQLGNVLNKTKNSISQYESNKREPDLQTLKEISVFFDVSIDYLLSRTDDIKISESRKKLTVKDLDLPEEIMKDIEIFFYDGTFAEEDKEKIVRDITKLYWKIKDEQKLKNNK